MCRINIIMKLKDETQLNIKKVQINQNNKIIKSFVLEIYLNSSEGLPNKMLQDILYIYLANRSRKRYACIAEINLDECVGKTERLDTTLTYTFKDFSFPEVGEYDIITFVAEKGLNFSQLLENKENIYNIYDFSVIN